MVRELVSFINFWRVGFYKLPLYEVIDLPFDYTRIGIPQELPNNTEIIYENSDGEILRFEYMRVEEGSAIIIDAENMEVTEIGVNGCPGTSIHFCRSRAKQL